MILKNIFHFLQRIGRVLVCYTPSFNDDTKKSFLLLDGLWETVKITFSSCFIAFLLGLLLGIYLYLLKLKKKNQIYFILNNIINIITSVPYLILVILLINDFLGPYFQLYYGFKAGFICLTLILIFIFARNCEQGRKRGLNIE